MARVLEVGMTALETIVKILNLNYTVSALVIMYPIIKDVRWENNPSLELVLRHRDKEEKEIKVSNGQITVENIKKFFSLVNDKWGVGVASLIDTPTGKFHIPMMDFHCEPTQENLEKIQEFCKFIGQKNGAILSSGRAFHYYGTHPMDQAEWLNFLGTCLLFNNYTGGRYIAHSLRKGYCTLRISVKNTHGVVPRIVAVL